jgi:hypothetical protein
MWYDGDESMKYTRFDPSACDLLREQLNAVLSQFAESVGVQITLGKMRYQSNLVTVSLEVGVVNEDTGVAASKAAETFKVNAKLFGFQADDLGKTFKVAGHMQTFTISGLAARATKRPILASADDGKNYSFASRSVLKALGRDVPDWLRD